MGWALWLAAGIWSTWMWLSHSRHAASYVVGGASGPHTGQRGMYRRLLIVAASATGDFVDDFGDDFLIVHSALSRLCRLVDAQLDTRGDRIA